MLMIMILIIITMVVCVNIFKSIIGKVLSHTQKSPFLFNVIAQAMAAHTKIVIHFDFRTSALRTSASTVDIVSATLS